MGLMLRDIRSLGRTRQAKDYKGGKRFTLSSYIPIPAAKFYHSKLESEGKRKAGGKTVGSVL